MFTDITEPVTAQAPTPSTTSTTSTPSISSISGTTTASTPPVLPPNYIKGGFLDTAPDGQRYLKAVYLGEYAQACAAALTNEAPTLSAAKFYSTFLRDANKHLRRGVIYEQQATCALSLKLQAIKLVAKRKAPPILTEILTKTTGAVYDSVTFEAFYNHLDAIYCFMLQNEARKGGD